MSAGLFKQGAAGLLLLLSIFWTVPSGAQIRFEFGAGDQIAVAYLEGLGYSEIRILANELFQVRAEACKEGIRYRFIVRIDGRIYNQERIGRCGAIDVAEARRILENAGYRRVDVSEEDGRFIAFGCLDRDRFRIAMNMRGEIIRTDRIGRCEEELSPGDVAALLRERGYDRIDFVDNSLPRYVVRACLEEVHYELVINARGQIVGERRIGRCTPPINPRDIVRVLADLGYTQIEVIDANLPRYVAEGCKAGRRYELTLDRFGRVTDEKAIGSCKRELSAEEIVQILTRRGFTRIDVVKADRTGYTVDACYRGRNLRMVFTIHGDFVSERDRGACASRTAADIVKTLEDEGLKDVQLQAEGCQRNRRIRVIFDRQGDEVSRVRIGNC